MVADSHQHARGEAEAIRILREILESPADTIEGDRRLQRAMADGKKLLRLLRLQPQCKQTGRPVTRVTPQQLREISRLDAKGWSQNKIAAEVKTSRDLVRHHLKPSAAMLATQLEENS